LVRKAVLALANGDIFEGIAFGANGIAAGEVVFNTSMTGYQEILTDPSYARQIVTLTHPHIGNTGVNKEDEESRGIWVEGLVIKNLPLLASNWRMEKTLSEYLTDNSILGIAEIDTRRLTRVLRKQGSQNGAIIARAEGVTRAEIDKALACALEFPGLKGMDLAREVTTPSSYEWYEGTWQLGEEDAELPAPIRHVVAYDFGTKRNILRMLSDRGCRLTVVPAQTSAEEVMAMAPDGVFLSNGPGDPDPCDYAIESIRKIVASDIPVFGICLGLQLLALATGAKTLKMGHGHHGANHPVKNLDDDTVLITSQNHGFCVDDSELPDNVRVTHRSLFDGTLQGLHLKNRPAFGFQGHPEASPGPHDAAPLFDHFMELMESS
jgi:carbamoyl-phosphate synthase small subunit